MALALDLPVLPVSTLAVLAWPARRTSGSVLAAIDARMGEVYAGWFRAEGEGLHAIGPEWMAAPSDIDVDESALVGVGTGFAAAEGALARALVSKLVACDPTSLPHAADLARLAALDFAAGRAIAPDALEPAYLRDKVALTLAEQGKK
jgi:tRNA threonylcarbamoyladenosine biosynthesis protein TsaB